MDTVVRCLANGVIVVGRLTIFCFGWTYYNPANGAAIHTLKSNGLYVARDWRCLMRACLDPK